MAFKQDRNDELTDALRAEVQFRYEPNFAHKSVASLFQALPGLIAFWPMSAVRRDSLVDQARDLAGGGYHLTNNNTALFGYDNLAPYVEFDGVDQFLSRADGGAADWADVLGTESHIVAAQRGLTFGGWFNFDIVPGASSVGLISKWGAVPQRSYYLLITNGVARFIVSNDGTAATSFTSTLTVTTTGWHQIIARYDPSTELKIWVNGTAETLGAAIPAAIFDGTTQFAIGQRGDGANWLEGRSSMCFLCAAALSDAIVGQVFQQSRAMFGV